ncbi:prokaryotic molybdopterin-containing oxidoreductase family, membrane subunit [Halomicrobium zhouii]|uniref:Prokaryotic molybdopterin-containing oxidoreductase family, membrane subunit n=1 Tax=Halomicrobium zhouii TaxID=767519 RepID=A0A1I6LWF8_9EURY|nr:NrfD/PsrC family molybdoenzyme membrane anchor subunit [Halomicrobium zhouii]SFS07773.1 prokaryotic molybdopterin-containing oxidoreductase family, membrane subunit [Halomicrobium zhouii]
MSTDVSGVSREVLVRPIQSRSKGYLLALAASLAAIGVWVFFYTQQLEHGMIVTNLADWGSGGGVPWGLYIGAFIWWVGIAHGGIILSAAVRLIGLDTYQPVARMAELLTIAALTCAGLFILIHVGRPDRLVTSVLPAWPTRVQWSPLMWDVTVITAYFVLTGTYLMLTIRYDVHRLRDQLPDVLEPVYQALMIGYTEKEDAVVERMVWWVAFAIIIMAPLLLHGGVIPWLFALLPSMAGWHGGVQGPSFLSIALTSAVSGIIIIAAAFRWAYDWEELIPDAVFRGLAKWLGFFSLLFLWLQLQQVVTGIFAAPTTLQHATEVKLSTPLYWVAIGLVGLTLAYVFASALKPSLFSIRAMVMASFAVLVGTLVEKTLFVVEGLQHAHFALYDGVPGAYVPSPVELSAVLGTAGIAVLFFLVVSKVIPVVELHAIEADHEEVNQ